LLDGAAHGVLEARGTAREGRGVFFVLVNHIDRVQMLLAFLRLRRREIFGDTFQAELEGVCRQSNPRQKATATELAGRQVSSLQTGVEKHLDDDRRETIETCLRRLDRGREQDLVETAEAQVRHQASRRRGPANLDRRLRQAVRTGESHQALRRAQGADRM
jgi:hypothetical protein